MKDILWTDRLKAFVNVFLRSGAWFVVLVYMFVVGIPSYYEYKVRVPDEDGLYYDQGIYIYDYFGSKKGYMTGVKNKDGINYYTCSYGAGGRHDCMLSDFHKELKGQPIKLWWFWQPVYWGSEQRRIVRLQIGGEEFFNRVDTEKRVISQKKFVLWGNLFYGMFCFFIIYFLCKGKRRKDNESAVNH